MIFVAVDYSFIYFIGPKKKEKKKKKKKKRKKNKRRREERIFQHVDSPDKVITNMNTELSCDA